MKDARACAAKKVLMWHGQCKHALRRKHYVNKSNKSWCIEVTGKMNYLKIAALVVGILGAGVTAQFPADCSCPDSCICNLEVGIIDCVDQRLKHVPVEINSCSWPGITKV